MRWDVYFIYISINNYRQLTECNLFFMFHYSIFSIDANCKWKNERRIYGRLRRPITNILRFIHLLDILFTSCSKVTK